MNRFCRLLFPVSLLLLLFCGPAFAWSLGSGGASESAESRTVPFKTLAEMADAMAQELKREQAGVSFSLYLDRNDIREDADVRYVPFAGMLVNELERAFSKAGYRLEGRLIDQADYVITVSYHRSADKVTLYLKLKRPRDGSYRNLNGTYELTLDRLPADAFAENLDGRITRMAAKIVNGYQRAAALSVFITPLVATPAGGSSPFAEYVTSRFKNVLAANPAFRLVEEKPSLKKLTARSTDGLGVGALDAVLSNADAVLEGSYLRGRATVKLESTLKGRKRGVVGTPTVSLPLSLISYSLSSTVDERLSEFGDTGGEQRGGVRVATSKGSGYQIYREGEVVSFAVQVASPLYIYVYNINPQGEVSLLYPKAGEREQPRLPGIVHVIPEDDDSWEIRVEPPFGKDLVKVFASDRRLPLPRISSSVVSRSFTRGGTRALKQREKLQSELAVQTTINDKDLVDYYRGVAAGSRARLYEANVFVETRGR